MEAGSPAASCSGVVPSQSIVGRGPFSQLPQRQGCPDRPAASPQHPAAASAPAAAARRAPPGHSLPAQALDMHLTL